jgi:hypothetical protein
MPRTIPPTMHTTAKLFRIRAGCSPPMLDSLFDVLVLCFLLLIPATVVSHLARRTRFEARLLSLVIQKIYDFSKIAG